MIQLKVLILPLLLLAAGCADNSDLSPLYGTPTVIENNHTPLQALCRIQEEFKALPKPVMTHQRYKGRWTSYHFGAAPVEHDGFYRIHLTSEALSFLSKHSRLEVVASLVPLFTVPGIGGEAAALLAGIPAGEDSVQGMHTRNLANLINKSSYQSPSNPGSWFDHANEYRSAAISLYGLTNTTESIHRKKPANYSQTVEYHIVNTLRAFSHLPLKVFSGEPPRMPQPHDEALVKSWVAEHSPPKINELAEPFIHSNRSAFSALAIFPMMPSPQSSIQRNEIYFMWMLNLEEEFWPALLQLTSGLQYTTKMRNDFRDRYISYVRNACNQIDKN